jgi:hypothetical protein
MAAPVNTVPPAITGDAMVGSLLTATDGTWTGGVTSFAFQWYRVNSNTIAIAGATQQTYLVVADDVDFQIRVGVTATNNTGSTVAFSSNTATVTGDFFIPEDGTGLDDSNSLCSLEDAAAYHAYRNNTAWGALSLGDRKAALIKATDYMQQVYRLKWSGTRTTGTQALDWPRAFVLRDDYQYQGLNGTTFIGGNFYFPADEVPLEVKNACAELALKSVNGELAPDIGQRVLREKVDVLEVQYDQYSPQFTQYRAIDNLLAPFLSSRGNTSKALIRT